MVFLGIYGISSSAPIGGTLQLSGKIGSSRIIQDSSRQNLTYLEAAHAEVNRLVDAVPKPKIGTVPASFAKWVENNSRMIGGR